MALSGTLDLNINVDDKDLIRANREIGDTESASKRAGSMFKSAFAGIAVGSIISSAVSAASSSLKSMVGELETSSAAWNNFDSNLKSIGWPQNEIDAAKTGIQKFAQQTVYSSQDISNAFSALVQGAHLTSGQAMNVVKGFGAIASSANDPKQAMGSLIDLYNGFNTTLNRIDFRQVSTALNGNTANLEKQLDAVTGTKAKWSDFESGTQTVTKEQFQQALALAGTNKALMANATQYKSASQALDGLKETSVNALTPLWNSISQVGIKVFSDFADNLQTIKIPPLDHKTIDDVATAIEKVVAAGKKIGKGFGDAIIAMLKPFADGKTGVDGVATAIGNLADKVSAVPPSTMQAIATGILGIVAASIALRPVISVFSEISSGIKGIGVAFSGIKNAITVGSALADIAKGSEDAIGKLQELSKESKLASAALSGIKMKDGVSGTISKITGSIKGLEIGSKVADGFSAASNAVKSLGASFIGMASGETAATVAGGALEAVLDALGIGLIIAAIAALILGIVYLVTHFNQVKEVASNVWKTIQQSAAAVGSWFASTFGPALSSVWSAIQVGMNAVFSVAQTVWNGIMSVVNAVVGWFTGTFVPVLQGVWDGITNAWNTLVGIAVAVWTAVTAPIMEFINWLSSTFQPLFGAIGNFISATLYTIQQIAGLVWRALLFVISTAMTAIQGVITTIWNTIVSVITTVLNGISAGINAALSFIVGVWNAIWNGIVTATSVIWNAIKSVISTVFNAISGFISTVLNAIKAVWNVVWNAISSFLTPIWNAIRSVVNAGINYVMSIINSVMNSIRGVWNSVWSAISGFIGPIWNSIKSVVSGAINSVKSTISNVLNGIKQVWDNIWGGLTGAVNKVMGVVKGIVNDAVGGIKDTINGIADVINGIADKIKKVGDIAKNIHFLSYSDSLNITQDGQLAYAGYGDFTSPSIDTLSSMNISGIKLSNFDAAQSNKSDSDNFKRDIVISLDGKTIAKQTVDDITKLQQVNQRRR